MSGPPDGLIAAIGLGTITVLKAILHLLNGLVMASNNAGSFCPVRLDLYLVVSYEWFATLMTLLVLVFFGMIPGSDEFLRKGLSMGGFFLGLGSLCTCIYLEAQVPMIMAIGSQILCDNTTAVKVYYWIIASISQIFALCTVCFTVATFSNRKSHEDVLQNEFRNNVKAQFRFISDAVLDPQGIEGFRNLYGRVYQGHLKYEPLVATFIKSYYCFKFTFERWKKVRHLPNVCNYCDCRLSETDQHEFLFVCGTSKHILHWDCFARASVEAFNFCPQCLQAHMDGQTHPTDADNLLLPFMAWHGGPPPERAEHQADGLLQALQL